MNHLLTHIVEPALYGIVLAVAIENFIWWTVLYRNAERPVPRIFAALLFVMLTLTVSSTAMVVQSFAYLILDDGGLRSMGRWIRLALVWFFLASYIMLLMWRQFHGEEVKKEITGEGQKPADEP